MSIPREESESEDESQDDEANLAVEHATSIIASMSSLEAVEDVLKEVKSRVQCLIYSENVNRLFRNVLASNDDLNPFKMQDRKQLAAIFNRCSITAHETFKDSECTLTTRREVCGASTTFLCETRHGCCSFIMTWYLAQYFN